MATYAIVKANMIVNRIEWDGVSAFPLDEGCALYPIDDLPEGVSEPVAVAERRQVLKSTIIARLNDAGLLAAARAALDADLYTRERWYAADMPFVYSDAPEALALLAAIGADPEVILA